MSYAPPPGAPQYGPGPGAMGPGNIPPPTNMVTKVELTISCTGLRDLDITSKSDPICVVYANHNGRLVEVRLSVMEIYIENKASK